MRCNRSDPVLDVMSKKHAKYKFSSSTLCGGVQKLYRDTQEDGVEGDSGQI